MTTLDVERLIHSYGLACAMTGEGHGMSEAFWDVVAREYAATPPTDETPPALDVEPHYPDMTSGVHRGPLPDESLTYACHECCMDFPCDFVLLARAARAVLDWEAKERWGGPHDWLASLIGYYAATPPTDESPPALDVERLALALHRNGACQHWLGSIAMCPMWSHHLDEAASLAREYATPPTDETP